MFMFYQEIVILWYIFRINKSSIIRIVYVPVVRVVAVMKSV